MHYPSLAFKCIHRRNTKNKGIEEISGHSGEQEDRKQFIRFFDEQTNRDKDLGV
jgi:hypothetical protein